MTDTETKLTNIHQATTVRLSDICTPYLQLSVKEAQRRACMNQLPFPTFRLTKSQKSPLLVSIKDLADHLDAAHQQATKEWKTSQV